MSLKDRWKQYALVALAVGSGVGYVLLGGFPAAFVLGRVLSFILFFLGVVNLFMALWGETPIYVRLQRRDSGPDPRTGRTLTISRFLVAAVLMFVALVLVYGPPTLTTPRNP